MTADKYAYRISIAMMVCGSLAVAVLVNVQAMMGG